MSMEHKAFIFNTMLYHKQIEPVIEECCKTKDNSIIKKYIDGNYSQICNPYTGDLLEDDWESELESNSMQELFDFVLGSCYEPDNDIGLGYAWDGVLEAIKAMHIMEESDVCVLGKPLIYADIQLNPGLMGLGIVEFAEVAPIKEILLKNQEKLENMELPEDVLYELNRDELMDAYDDLCSIYKRAEKEGKGILFTF